MIFWATAALMALFVSVPIGRTVWAHRTAGLSDEAAAAAKDLSVYRDQLAEVERDQSRGLLSEADAERTRTEISRRILAADAAADRHRVAGTGPSGKLLAGGVAIVLIAGSLALYGWMGQPGYGDFALADRIAFAEELRANRPDQASAEASMPPSPAPEGVTEAYLDLMEKLRATVAERPDDLQGNTLLAQNEARIGNYAAAARAQEAVLRIKGAEGKAIFDTAQKSTKVATIVSYFVFVFGILIAVVEEFVVVLGRVRLCWLAHLRHRVVGDG